MIAEPASHWSGARAGLRRRASTTREHWSAISHPVAVGVAAAVGLTIAWALGAGLLVQAVAVGSLLLGLMSPLAGLAMIALIVPLREVEVLGPIGYPVLLVLATAGGVLARQLVADPRPTPGLLLMLGAGYLVLSAASIVPAVSGLDAEQTSGSVYELLQLASGFVVVAVGMVLFRTEDPKPYLRLVVLAAVIASILAIVLVLRGSWDDLPVRNLFSNGEVTRRAVGPFRDANYFSLSMAVACVLALGLAEVARGPRRIALLAAAVLVAIGPVLSFGRGGLIAMAVGLVTALFLRSRPLGLGLAVLLLGGALVVGPLYVDARLSITTGGLYAQPTRELAESDSFRIGSLFAGMELAAENPAFGIGFGQFRFRAEELVGSSRTAYPHDTWIKLLAEQGLAGVVAFGALVLATLVHLVRRRHPLVATTTAVLLTYAVGATFLEPLVSLQTSIALWLLLGATLAPGGPQATERIRSRRYRVQPGSTGRAAQAQGGA